MRIASFRATSDLVGRRIHVSWDVLLEGTETLADIPPVRVRRKTRDFEFSPDSGAAPDPFLVYDSQSFPPPSNPPQVTVTLLPEWTRNEGATRTVFEALSVAKLITLNDALPTSLEVLRTTTAISYDAGGRAIQQHVDLLDYGSVPGALVSGTTYYYQLYSTAIPADADVSLYRATASATESYGLNRTLYESLPGIYRRHDVTRRPAIAGMESIPEAAPCSGQLRRFLDPFGLALDSMRSTAEGLRTLHDIDNVDYRYLPLLAQWIGWNLSYDSNIPIQRSEIKNATRLYRGMGTVPTLRAIVSRYTGWYTQVAEFAQNILRTNQLPYLHIFSVAESVSGWRGSDDAAVALGFGSDNQSALGSGTLPATLTSSNTAPFALRPGMELSITADELSPEVVRFGPGDFADILSATADEVVTVINRALGELSAVATSDGRIQLRSDSVGPNSTLRINASTSSLITLEGAPQGRLSTLVSTPAIGKRNRVRLFYEASSTATPALRSIRYKTFAQGVWSNSQPLPGSPNIAQSAPSVIALAADTLWLAWLDMPASGQTRIRTIQGTERPLQPARLVGQASEPFTQAVGARLTLRGIWGSDAVTLSASDFANPARATAREVAAAINARAPHVKATVQPNNALLLTTLDGGPDVYLELDLRNSLATQALGFGARNRRATGSWSDTIDWQPAADLDAVAGVGYYSDLYALRDGSGGLWLFWAAFTKGSWSILSTHWNGTTWSIPEARTSSVGGSREPYAVLDAQNRTWLFWASRQGVTTEAVGETWIVRRSIFDPTANTWGPETDVTTAPTPGTIDREPAALLLADGTLRLFFRSNRTGGSALWSTLLDADGLPIAAAPTMEPTPTADSAPTPLVVDGQTWVLYRSDASIPLAQVEPGQLATASASAATWASMRVPDAGSVRLFAGSTSLVPTDLARYGQRQLWNDTIAYTAQKPDGQALTDTDYYTRGTIGLYVSQGTSDNPLTAQNVQRLRQLLQEFLPINIRALVILAPSLDNEYVYRSGADIGELYQDKYPYSDYLTGLSDSAAVALPDWRQFRSNTLSDITVNTSDLTTLRSRTYYPPLQ
jgi:phage tail-like protein